MAAFDLEAARENVWEKLSQLTGEELGTLCEGINITVEPTKANRKWALIGMITQHLAASTEVDEMSDDAKKQLFDNIDSTVDGMMS